jgi:hypothetical protein
VTVTVDRTTQRFSSSLQPEPDVCVLHTTEGMSWPPYEGGGTAPHATIEAIPGKGIRVREHIPWTQNAKALVNLPGGVETNRRGALQFELKGTCDPKHKGDPDWYFWPDADDVVLKSLADYLRPILTQFAIPFTGPTFQAYSASYGARGRTNTVRFTNAQWLAFEGICGHQHVPENVHGDPGAFPIVKLVGFLRGTAAELTEEQYMATLKITNPLTGEGWSVARALWSIWTYVIKGHDNTVATQATVKSLVGAVQALSQGEPFDEAKLLASIEEATKKGIMDAGAALNAAQSSAPK